MAEPIGCWWHDSKADLSRMKRALGLKRDLSDPKDVPYQSESITNSILERVLSNLRKIAAKRLLPPSTNINISELFIVSLRRHRFRLTTIYSTTSSLWGNMFETPPILMANREVRYT